MRDICIKFGGSDGTQFDFNHIVEGKKLYVQKYLVNTITAKDTDSFFPDRGTDLLKDAVGGGLVDTQRGVHIGNFAALDTIYFCSYEENPDIYNGDDYVMEYTLRPVYYNNNTQSLYFNATFGFKDDTNTDDAFNLTFSD